MEDNLTKLNTFKSITLTDVERNSLHAHGAHVIATMIPVVTESLFHRGVQHGLRIALSTFLFIVFVGSSVSVVANSAMPGDDLYPIKIRFNEEVKGIFLKTSEEKVVWQKNRIESRMNEMQTLAENNGLTPAKQKSVQKALDTHVADLSKELTTLSATAPTTALAVTASLEQSLKANKQAIQNTLSDDSNKLAALKSVDGTIDIVNAQEVQIIAQEIDDITNDINAVSGTTVAQPTAQPTAVTPTTFPSSTPVTPVAP